MAINIVNLNEKRNGMIFFPSRKDTSTTKKFRVKKSKKAEDVDFTKSAVTKPWGFEYLCFENEHLDIWEFHLNPPESTSFHCHPGKDALKILLEGQVELKTMDRIETLFPGDIRLIKGGVLHQTTNNGKDVARVLEIESPPNKKRLIRISDAYGRKDCPYISSSLRSSLVKNVLVNYFFRKEKQTVDKNIEIFSLLPKNKIYKKNDITKKVLGIRLKKISSSSECIEINLLENISQLNVSMFVVISGTLLAVNSNNKKVLSPGEACFIPNLEELELASSEAELLLF
ncbi:MAG: cupin domain-containing protein [Candidatus Moraniibacteriota bacterium]